MRKPDTGYKDNHTLYSKEYNDIYFSTENGLAESEYTFLKGNDLFDQWPDYKNIRICETGFGTGLNFLVMAKLFKQQAKPGQKLFYTSIEKFPLDPQTIRQSLSHWQDHFPQIFDDFIAQYPMRINGFHPIMISKDIYLILIFDDVLDALNQLKDKQDYWFLDGFSPAQNPDMWQDDMFEYVQNLSHNRTKLATFTAAGKVTRGLEKNNFLIKKVPGFGMKREMTTAQFQGDASRPKDKETPQKISIAGAGLSGLSTGWLLDKLGLSISIFEKNAAAFNNASANDWGIINPRIGAERIPAFDYFNAAFALFNRVHQEQLKQIGALHLAKDEKKQIRFEKFVTEIAWPDDQAEQKDEGLFFPDAGLCSPKALSAHYAKDLNINYSCTKKSEEVDILATSFDSNDALSYAYPLQKIRGQVSYATTKNNHPLTKLDHVISAGSYVAPISDNKICFGATFQHWEEHLDVTEDDHQYNLDKLSEIDPAYAKDINITDGWSGFRCASKDRMPIIGKDKTSGTYLNIAHGSHGMISSLAGAFIIAYELGLIPQPFSKTVLEALSPQRYDKE